MGNTPGSGINSAVPGEHSNTSTDGSSQQASRSPSKVHMSATSNNVGGSPFLSSKTTSSTSQPPVISTVSSTPLNGHLSSTPTGTRPHFAYTPNSMMNPSQLVVSPSPRSSPARSHSSSKRTSALRKIPHSRIGLIPAVKYNHTGLSVNLPSRGSVRIPPADRITSNTHLRVFSSSKSQALPSTDKVLAQLQHKAGKRKCGEFSEDTGPEATSHIATTSSSSLNSSTKRRRHDSNNKTPSHKTLHSDGLEFLPPSPLTIEATTDHQSTAGTSNPQNSAEVHAAGVSPKRDGHLRTAIASSYSSSRRSKKRQCSDMLEQPLYKRSINISYQPSSRESSLRGSPVPIDKDSESETGSRISVTPLPSLKSSPRSSPVPQANSYMSSTPMLHMPSSLLTPKVEAKVIFPSVEEPISGFVATLEDRAHDDDVNLKRAKRLLGVTAEAIQQSPSAPKFVMPIIKPSLSLPGEKTTSVSKVEGSVSSLAAVSSAPATSQTEATASSAPPVPTQEPPCTVPPSTIAASTASAAEISRSEGNAPPNYVFATSSVPSQPTASNSESAAHQTTSVAAVGGGSEVKFGVSISANTCTSAATSVASAPFTFGLKPTAAAPPATGYGQGTTATCAATQLFDTSTAKSQASPSLIKHTSVPAAAPAFTFGLSQSSGSHTSVQSTTAPFTSNSGALFLSSGQQTTASSLATTTSTTTTAAPFSFGSIPASLAPISSSKPAFTFGLPLTAPTTSIAMSSPSSVASTAAFILGTSQSTTTTTAAPSSVFAFGASQPAASGPTPPTAAFGFGKSQTSAVSSAAAFTFGGNQSKVATSSVPSVGFTFGVTQSSAQPSSDNQSALFTFGQPANGKPSGTAVSGTAVSGQAPTSSVFSAFGSKSSTEISSAAEFPFGANTATSSTPFGASKATTSSLFGTTSSTPFGATAAITTTPFGATTATSSTPFGATTATSSTPFGASKATSSTPFGATAATSTTPFGATGATSSTPFGAAAATSTTPFGAATATSTTPFGAAGATFTTPFGATGATSTTPFGAAGATSTTPFGATAATCSTNSIFGSQSTTSNPFSASAAGSSTFGGVQPPAAGLFGSTTTTTANAFGSSSVPSFGVAVSSSSAPVMNFKFGVTSTAAPGVFGQPSNTSTVSKPTFNFGTSANASAFGATNNNASGVTPSFGATNNNASGVTPSFGASTQAATAAAFGSTNSATSTPVFGASNSQPAANNANLFGAQSKPVFNFGGSTTPSFGASTAGVAPFGSESQGQAANGAAMFSLGTSKPAPRRRTRR